MQRGEVWWAILDPPWGRRPVLLLARNDAYQRLNAVVTAPLTSRIRHGPTLVPLSPTDDGVPRPSVVSTDNLQAVRVESLTERITILSPERMAEVEEAILFALDIRR